VRNSKILRTIARHDPAVKIFYDRSRQETNYLWLVASNLARLLPDAIQLTAHVPRKRVIRNLFKRNLVHLSRIR